VVEDGCSVPIEGFRTDNIGVDIVFAQDLSGSMGSAITGVRSSVTAFADDLANRGLNVQIGAVGYSGPGTIPSTPASSTCEYLGPFQDLTDPTTFQSHVSQHWYPYDGCDGPENGLEAIEMAHGNMSWRSGAVRHYIDITDVSHHWSGTSCNGMGPCSDQTIESLVSLVGNTVTIHAVAPSDAYYRTYGGGVDPWMLAEETGGTKLDLGTGYVDLTTIGLSEVLGETVSFTFNSSSTVGAFHNLRIRVEVEVAGTTYRAELFPGVIQYAPVDASLIARP
jgi:hypothetical protein